MALDEKLPLLETPPARTPRKPRSRMWWTLMSAIFVWTCFRSYLMYTWQPTHHKHNIPPELPEPPARCPQVKPMLPSLVTLPLTSMDQKLQSQSFLEDSIARMQGAVRIPSESFDDMGPIGEDSRWDIFYNMSSYLTQTFPLVSQHLQLEKVNTHGLLYTWQGSNPTLKPMVLNAHQDVVPVANATKDQWEHDAFGGFYDGTYLWGRGSSDCKNTLIASLEAVEELIRADFKPKRTIILAYGFDEEISGFKGARFLAAALLKRYKGNGAALILDEGRSITSEYGMFVASPGVAEKGYIDVEIVIRMPGGHSSLPPPHTGIGVAAELVTLVEKHPYTPKLCPQNPILGLLQCAEAHSPAFPPRFKKSLNAHDLDSLADQLVQTDYKSRFLITTSQAVDLIEGGVKVNALPERTSVVINHRVNVGETTNHVKKQLTNLASKIATKHNLTLHAFSDKSEIPLSISLNTLRALEPAPITPTIVDAITPYFILAGTTRALYKDMIVAPGLMTANTDTRHYWDLSEHIFRFNPGWDSSTNDDPFAGIHTINEKISMVNHIKAVQWYSLFIRNVDEAAMP